MKSVIYGVALLVSAVVVSTANASVTFSFASDSNNDGPTFFGHGTTGSPTNVLTDAAAFDNSGQVVVGLMVDTNGDAPGGGTTFNSLFSFTGATTNYAATPFAGGFLHSWSMSGTFSFTDTGSGLQVLAINFTNAVFTSFSASASTLGTTAALQDSEALDTPLTFVPGAPLIGLGINAAALASNEGFSFALANIRSAPTAGAPLTIGTNGAWLQQWVSEGSFAAAAQAIPGPGSLALLGFGMLASCRRRRA